ncbi:MAG: M28 family peptidase [Chloroflexi bacterium]|nr:M28 family peptidase [Chloroflexota bacterium]
MSEERVLAELSAERAWQTIETIVEQFPSRLAGTDSAWNAAGFMHDQLRANGVAAELMEYPGLVSFPGQAQLEMVSPERRTIPATVLAHSAPTGAEWIEAEVVDVGTGSWERCEAAGIRGKVTLSELSYAPPRQEKARIMSLQGAAGAIMLNWGYDDSTLLPYGSVKPAWGNPTRLTIQTEMPTIPCLGVSRADGLALRALAQRGPVRVRLRAECSDAWRTLRQAIGRVPGVDDGPELVILGGHMDAWYGQSATDNAAGNACFVELARAFARHAGELRRSLVVGFWVGHETGTMIGSSTFVDRRWDDVREHAVAYVQIDQPALVGTSLWESRSDVELRAYHTAVERRLLGGMPLEWGRLTKIGDTSFFGVGVPSIASRGAFTREEVKAMGDANLGWWHHTDENTTARLDKASFGAHLQVYAGYLWGLLTLPILPMRFTPTVQQMVDRLEQLGPHGADVDLASASGLTNEALQAVRRLDAAADTWRECAAPDDVAAILNAALKGLSRILIPLGGTTVDRYSHDPYGLSAQATVLPGLYDLPRLGSLPPTSDERYLLMTELTRQRNRLADAMRETRDLAARTVDAIDG